MIVYYQNPTQTIMLKILILLIVKYLITPCAKITKMNHLLSWIKSAFQPDVIMCSGKLALIVGTTLMLINYGDKLYLEHTQAIDWIKIGFTYLVPYFVSSYSAVDAMRRHHEK